ncbi:hypothetical protein ACXWRS_11200, partial [Streptococcus pyogenes]
KCSSPSSLSSPSLFSSLFFSPSFLSPFSSFLLLFSPPLSPSSPLFLSPPFPPSPFSLSPFSLFSSLPLFLSFFLSLFFFSPL